MAGVELFKRAGGQVSCGRVTTDADEKLHLDGKPLEANLIVVATGAWMADMYPRTVKPISQIVGINILYTSTMVRLVWTAHGRGLWGKGGGGHPGQNRSRQ